MASHVRKGDMVKVVAGRARNGRHSVGRVLRVIPRSCQVVVEGVNVCKKHVRPNQQNQQGGLIEKEMPIHLSNVQPVADGAPTRVRFEHRDDGSKVRVAARNGEVLGTELKKARK